MQITAGALIAALVVPLVSAGCYSGGEVWPDKQDAINKLDAVCAGLQGTYTTGQGRGKCVNGPAGKNVRYDFHVTRFIGPVKDTRGLELSKSECIDGLKKEITGCDHGGDTKYTNWEYR